MQRYTSINLLFNYLKIIFAITKYKFIERVSIKCDGDSFIFINF